STGNPAFRRAVAVPPGDTISQPSSISPWANGMIPRLSLTEISARGMHRGSRRELYRFGERNRVAGGGGGEHHRRQQAMLGLEHAPGEPLRRVVRLDGDPRLRQDRTA